MLYEKEIGYFCSICQKFCKTKKGPYISELAQTYHTDKIRKHFDGVLKAGHKGTNLKGFSPAMSKVYSFSLKVKRNSETNEKIEMSSSTEQALRKWSSFRNLLSNTLCMCKT